MLGPRLAFALALAPLVFASTPTVNLGGTIVAGAEFSLLRTEFFGGIPYAKPPVGQLRLKPPVKAKLNTKTFDARQFSSFCLQPPTETVSVSQMSEDCLTVNVFRPSGVNEDAKLPVFFWTYGGGFLVGSANIYNASGIIAQSVARGTPIVFVSFNYRLGPLGFPQGREADQDGVLNLALSDQFAALEWVQENIGHFGGDPRKVTVGGQSAGAIMTAVQFLNQRFEGVARAGIMESGSAATPVEQTASTREGNWVNFVSGVSECAHVASSGHTLDCLRRANSTSIFKGLTSAIGKSTEIFPFDPTLDGEGGFLPDRPSKIFQRGLWAKLPFIAGTVLDEGTFVTPRNPEMDYGDSTLRQIIYANLTPSEVSPATLSRTIEQLLELYPDVPALGSPFGTGNETFGLPSGYKRLAAILGDVGFLSQRRLWQSTAASKGVKTFGYLFTQPQIREGRSPALGVSHASDVPYVLGSVNQTQSGDVELSRIVMDYWISFVVGLDPSDGKGFSRPQWDAYGPGKEVVMQLNSDDLKLIPDTFRGEQTGFVNRNPVTFLHRRGLRV